MVFDNVSRKADKNIKQRILSRSITNVELYLLIIDDR